MVVYYLTKMIYNKGLSNKPNFKVVLLRINMWASKRKINSKLLPINKPEVWFITQKLEFRVRVG